VERDAGGIPPSRPKDPVFVAAKLEPATQQTRSEEGEEEEEEKQATRRREQDCEEEELYTVLEADVEAAIQVLVLLFPPSCLPNASFPVTVVLDGCCSRLAFFAFLRGFMTHGSLLRRHFCPMFCL
jgi:hypothetical protein